MELSALLEWSIQGRRKHPEDVRGVNKKPAPPRQYLLQPQCVEATIAKGEQVIGFMVERLGPERTEGILAGMLPPARDGEASSQAAAVDKKARAKAAPHGFWRKFMEDALRQRYTDSRRVALRKALAFVA